MSQHFKTAWIHIRRVPYQALAAIFIMVITFFVAAVLAFLAYASSQTLHYFETKPQIIAFLKDDATPDLVSSLQRKLGGDQRVKNIGYVSKEQALEIYKTATSDNPILSELVSPSVFPASLEFSVVDLVFAEEVINEVKEESVVAQVVFTASLGDGKDINTVIDNLKNITNYIRVGGAAVVGFLLASSFLTLLVIIGMRVAARREEVETLMLLGATPGFIKMPFIIEALFYALFGSFVGWIFSALLILYATPFLTSYFKDVPIFPQDPGGLFLLLGQVLGAELVLAFFLGLLGSLIALGRYRKT